MLPAGGGEPRLVTPRGPSYWHGWSPDGRTLAYCARRDGEYDVYTISVEGGEETRLTTAQGLDDGPDYAPDGRIWFNSVRTGVMKIWRMDPDGGNQTQMTRNEEYADWFPHPSPDGTQVILLSYDRSVEGPTRRTRTSCCASCRPAPANRASSPACSAARAPSMQYSLYLHIPFCRHRCAYCDFNTYAGQEHEIQPYVEALCEEIADIGHRSTSDSTIHTVFIGGGTPSLLKPSQLRTIMSVIREFFYLAADPEITLEANPGTVTFDDMQALRELGINRLSFGMQSANGEELRMLERGHTYLEILQAVSAARRAGFDNLNVDLIYGLPEQKLQTWQTTVQRALDLLPEQEPFTLFSIYYQNTYLH